MGDRRTFTKRETGSNKALNISCDFKMSLFYVINFIINLSYSTTVSVLVSDCNTYKIHIIRYFEP